MKLSLLEMTFPLLLFLVDSSEDDILLTSSSDFILLLGTTHTAAKELVSSAWKVETANSFYQSGVSWRKDEGSTLGTGVRTLSAETSGFWHLWN